MIWMTSRLQRTETVIAAAILALVAAVLVPTGLSAAAAYDHDGLSSCLLHVNSPACAETIGSFQMRFETVFHLTTWFTLVPGLIGVLLAAPFILELEHGTYRLAWTQSITRRRWIATKLALPVALALVLSGVLVALSTWWRAPFVHLYGRLEAGTYDVEGTVALGYALFALGLALAVGVIWRRAAAALTVAFVLYVASRIFVDTWLRNRLLSPAHASWKGGQPMPASVAHGNILSQTVTGGGAISHSSHSLFGGHSTAAIPSGHAGMATIHAVYQPASQFWPLQGVETGLFAGAALLLMAFAAWWTHERVA